MTMVMRRTIIIFTIISLFAGLMLIYFVDPAKIGIFGICPIYEGTGFLCPSCGMTRALHNLLHLRFKEAYEYNPLIYLLAILVTVMIFSYILKIRGKRNLINNKIIITFIGVAIVLIIVYTICRNIGI